MRASKSCPPARNEISDSKVRDKGCSKLGILWQAWLDGATSQLPRKAPPGSLLSQARRGALFTSSEGLSQPEILSMTPGKKQVVNVLPPADLGLQGSSELAACNMVPVLPCQVRRDWSAVVPSAINRKEVKLFLRLCTRCSSSNRSEPGLLKKGTQI